MPDHLDILFERLKKFDEVSLLELLDINSEELLERFRDVIIQRQDYLFGEVEELSGVTGEEYGMDEDDWDGFQIIDPNVEEENNG